MRFLKAVLIKIIILMLLILSISLKLSYAEDKKDEDLTDEQIQQLMAVNNIPMSKPAVVSDTNLQAPVSDSTYTLGINDVIQVEVLRHPEVSGQFMINNEGKIQYGFVGDILIKDHTKDEVSKLIKEKLGEYIITPEITVTITQYNSKVVYVIGEVGLPGKIYMRGDTITAHEALVQAGLPLLSAKAAKSLLITPTDDGKPGRKNVNVHKLLYEGDLRENLVMKPGDTLFVPPTVMAKLLRTIQPIAAPISTAAGTGRTVTTGF